MMKTIFITGISSGIGKALAEAFLKNGDCVIGTVRDENSVSDLSKQYPEHLKVVQVDFLQPSQIEKIPSGLNSIQIKQIDILINNAGMALAAPFQHQKFSEIQNTIQVNLLAVMQLTQLLIPFIPPSTGRIIQISSVSGENGTPFLAAYCASKYAIEGFSESLRREMNLFGIKVIIVGPGSVQTPIWDKGFQKIKDLYQNTVYKNSFNRFMAFADSEKNNALPVSDLVDVVFKAAFSQSPSVRYAPVPRAWMNRTIPRLLPKFFFDRLTCKALGLVPGNDLK